MNEKLKNLNKKQFEKCLITLEMLTFETPKIYTALNQNPTALSNQKTSSLKSFGLCIVKKNGTSLIKQMSCYGRSALE